MKNIKAYKHIQESEKVLKTLSNEAKTMDNTVTRLKELNVLIKMLNSFKEMLSERYYTDYIDVLLLSKMKQVFINENLTNSIQWEKGLVNYGDGEFKEVEIMTKESKDQIDNKKYFIPLNEFLLSIDQGIDQGKEVIKEDLVNILKHYQLSNILSTNPENLKDLRDNEYWEKCINNTLNQVKKRIQWNKRFNKI